MGHREKKLVVKRYFTFCVGVFFNYAAYLVLLGLQSSINVKNGLGLASITATAATSLVFGLFCTSIVIRRFGPKTCILFCEFTYILYIAANACPEPYVLITAGALTGMGEAIMSPVLGLFVVHYARCYSRHAEKSTSSYVAQFFGIFYSVFQFSRVCGSLISYAILFGGKSPSQPRLNSTDNTSFVTTPVVKDLSICGINDCQDPNITQANEDRYEPASMTLIYILVGVTDGMVILAMLIHKFLTKPIDISLEIQDELSQKKDPEGEVCTFMMSTVKATIIHIINPRQLLLTPFALYSGIFISFGLTEVSRAFGSCLLGIENVGLLTALYGAADAVMSILSLKITSWLGRDIPVVIGYCIDMANYMICLFWIPTESSLWVVYVIYIMIGFIDGIWQPLVNEIHAASFPENRDIALIVWNLYVLLGITWQTAWSTSLCVFAKIYFQIGLLTFSVLCYGLYQYESTALFCLIGVDCIRIDHSKHVNKLSLCLKYGISRKVYGNSISIEERRDEIHKTKL